MKLRKNYDLRTFLLLAVPAEIVYLFCHYYYLSRIPGSPWIARLILLVCTALIFGISWHFSRPAHRKGRKRFSKKAMKKGKKRD